MEYSLITDPSALQSLQPEWRALLAASVTPSPFLEPEYLSAWWQGRGGGEWPQAELALVAARRAGRLSGIAPCFLSAGRWLLLGSTEISDLLDVISSPADLPDFLEGLLEFAASAGFPAWTSLDWCNLPQDSSTAVVLRDAAGRRGWQFTRQIMQPSPYVALPGDFEAYLDLLDKKQRHEIRRKLRRAEEADRRVRWYIVSEAASLEDEVDQFLALMAQDPAKADFLTTGMRAQFHLIARAAFTGGWLQLCFLEVDGRKAAGYLNFDHSNRIWVYNSGLDLSFQELSPGWVLLSNSIRWAVEHGRSEFDFMRGDEGYKYRFGAVNRFIERITITP